MADILVSFVTRPNEGSEGGVGWAFLEAAANISKDKNTQLFGVIDQRDYALVRTALAQKGLEKHCELLPVRMPRIVQQIQGARKTRAGYLAWSIKARRSITKLTKQHNIVSMHQVTFATSTLPPVFYGLKDVHKIWGPVGVPMDVGSKLFLDGRKIADFARRVARYLASDCDLIIATNIATKETFKDIPVPVELEPNIVVEALPELSQQACSTQLCMVGLLVERKRPHLAIEMLQYEEFADYQLAVIGDGPLRPQLQSLVSQLGLENRVTFHGKLTRENALKEMSKSRLLIHPSRNEGAGWVIGEAAALGVPAVAFKGSGVESTIELCNNGGVIAEVGPGDLSRCLGAAVTECLSKPVPGVSNRWSSQRLGALLECWRDAGSLKH